MTAGIEIRRQFFAAMAANLSILSFGWNCAWANANFLELQSPSTRLASGPISEEEGSSMMSLVCVGGLVANIAYLYFIDRFGRKYPLLFLAPLTIIAWALVIFAENVYWLYASRILFGFVGGGAFVTIPIFTAEICSDSVRGMVNSMGFLGNSFGALISLCIAMFMDYRQQAMCAIFVPCLFAFVFYFVPESPVYLQQKNRIEEAEAALEFYKGTRKLPETEKFVNEKKSSETESGLSFDDFFGTRASRKAVFIAIVLIILPQFCGCYLLLSYTAQFFKEAGSTLTPVQSSVIITIVQLVANLVTISLIDRLGRKILIVSSSIATSLGLLILAMHQLYREDLPDTNWVPVFGLSFTIFVATVGLLPVPFTITIDVLPPKIRNVTMTLCSMNMWVLGYGMNFVYFFMLKIIAMHGCLIVFSSCCFSVALFALIFIPETKGKSYDRVAKLLEK